MSYETRKQWLEQIEKDRNTKVILFVTGTHPSSDFDIDSDCIDRFVRVLKKIDQTDKISLILHTNGGNTDAAWQLVNLIRMYCDHFEVIVPHRAMGVGTFIALGANNIVMTRQSAMGSIEPSIRYLLDSCSSRDSSPAFVSDEAVNMLIEFARSTKKLEGQENKLSLWQKVLKQINPLVIGEVIRHSSNIRRSANNLLNLHINDYDKQDRIVRNLCLKLERDNHIIPRREAEKIGLPVEAPDENLDRILDEIYESYCEQMLLEEEYYVRNEFSDLYNPNMFKFISSIIECPSYGGFELVQEIEATEKNSEDYTQIKTSITMQKWRESNAT